MGIVADSVSQVTELPPQDIMPAPAFGTDIHIDFLRGMAKSGQKFLLILDIDKVLSNHDTPGSANSANHASDGPPDKEEVHSATCEIVSNSNEGARS